MIVLTALLAGVGALGLSSDHWAVRGAAFVAAALAALGYAVSRAVVKAR